MEPNYFSDFLKLVRPFLVVVALLGIAVAFIARHGGFNDLYQIALIASTSLVIASLIGQIIVSLGRRELGLDVIALLSMSAALLIGEHLAAAVVALMYSGGQYLESIAEGRARREMTALLTRAPRMAVRRRNDQLEDIPVEAIETGDLLVVRRGDIVPTDGTLLDDASLDEAALTGEAFPVRRSAGQAIMSGSANAGDLFNMIAGMPAGDSTYAGIIRLVEAAHNSKAPMSRLADRYALAFLFVTIFIAAVAWLQAGDPARAVAVLVVATPCPLILAVPVAWTAGLSRAASIGFLMKGADVLEKLGTVRTIVFDKTGTLTDGQPHLAAIKSAREENELLRLIASLDQGSSHVAAKALVATARSRGLALTTPTDVSERPGEGISGLVGAEHVTVGGVNFIAAKVPHMPTLSQSDQMSAAVAIDGQFAGFVLFRDALRDGAQEALTRLKRHGSTRLVLATGDRADVAHAIADGLPLDEVRAELTPEQKIELVRAEKSLAPVMMVGDGINDAPALAAADIGVAMATRGSAAATEAADAVLLVDRLDRICDGVEIANDCRRIATQSVAAGIGLSIAAMLVAALGYLQPVEGALVQEAIDVAVIVNALRALRAGSQGSTRWKERLHYGPIAASTSSSALE